MPLFDYTPDPTPEFDRVQQLINAEVRRRVHARCAELERQAETMLAMGFAVDELVVVHYPDGHAEIKIKEI